MTAIPSPSEPPTGGVVASDPAERDGSEGARALATAPPPSSDERHALELMELGSILPSDADWANEASLLHAEYSPELQKILATAAEQVSEDAGPSSSLPPADHHGAVGLSPELLALLDEPLIAAEEDSGTGTPSPEGSWLTPEARSPDVAEAASAHEPEAAVAEAPAEASPHEPAVVATAPVPRAGGPAAPSSASVSVRPPSSAPAVAPAKPLDLPAVLGDGDAVVALARSIAGRASGALVLSTPRGSRRILLQDGDLVTAGSELADETLVAFLGARGDLERKSALAARLPAFGRHAGAALVAHGYLAQGELWPVLRDHAEWIVGLALAEAAGTCELDREPPSRYRAEPSVFGGAPGAEIFVEALRRVVPRDVALRRLGGPSARLDEGPSRLLGECALSDDETNAFWGASGQTVGEVLGESDEGELAVVLYAMVCLGVLVVRAPARAPGRPEFRVEPDPLDGEAIRMRVRARMALVEDADYFALLGVSRSATSYEIRRAYLALRRAFEPARLLTAQTADLATDVRLIVDVLDEAYEILRDVQRRERYRRAIETSPS